MYRFGDKEKHPYVVGVYNKKDKAEDEAEKEKMYRGCNKYFPEILECEINKTKNYNTILRAGN
jgi:hypothetical protein